MNEKIILDLCGGTGSWSKPYVEAGYTVHVITLPDYSIADWWQASDSIRFRKNNPRNDGMSFLEVPIEKIHGILAAPPCTQFSIARTRAKIPRDFNGGMETVRNCMSIIWAVRMSEKSQLKFWALENPVGYLRQFLGKPCFSFRQWEFGDGREKPTDLWGYFNTPKKTMTDRPGEFTEWGRERVDPELKGFDRAAMRAVTPQGFARAFFRANK